VVVAEFDIVRVSVLPAEADPPLVVHANAVLSFAVARKCLEPVARRDTQIVEAKSGVYEKEFSMCPPLNVRWEPPRALPSEDLLGLRIPEAPDHGSRVARSLITSSVIRGPAQQAVAPDRPPRGVGRW
jgi:hypothetical protein